MKQVFVAVVTLAALTTGCSQIKQVSKVKQVIGKDIRIEDQLMLLEKYRGKVAWTRTTLEDLTERETPGEPKKRIAPRDTKIEIVDLNFAFNGAVTVTDPKRRKIVHGLSIERPLTVEKFEARLGEILWFKSPLLRHVDYIREWGKRTARAVRNHEVFIGMPKDAALESWGIPSVVNRNPIGDKDEEQWVYKGLKKSRYIYIIDGKVSKWEE